MQSGRLDKNLKRKLLLQSEGLFDALGVELTEEQHAAVEQAERQESKRIKGIKRWAKEHREELNSRAREARAANPERYRANEQKKRERNREMKAGYDKAYYTAHREEISKRKRARYAAHREEELAKAREWRATNREEYNARIREYRAGRKEIRNAQQRAHRAAHPDLYREYNRKAYERRKARKQEEKARAEIEGTQNNSISVKPGAGDV